MSAVYQRKREHEQKLGALLEELRTDYLSIVETLALVVEARETGTDPEQALRDAVRRLV